MELNETELKLNQMKTHLHLARESLSDDVGSKLHGLSESMDPTIKFLLNQTTDSISKSADAIKVLQSEFAKLSVCYIQLGVKLIQSEGKLDE